VLHHEFSLIHVHGFLTALPRPDSQLPRLTTASSMLPRPRSRSRQNCLTHITGNLPLYREDRVLRSCTGPYVRRYCELDSAPYRPGYVAVIVLTRA